MKADWERLAACLAGKKIALGDADLAYRTLGEQRAAQMKQAAAAAWAALRAELSPQTMPAFPAPPVTDRRKVAGKLVELPQITERDIITDLGVSYAATGSPADGYYFAALRSPEMQRLYEVFHRYRGRVNPAMPQKYRYIAKLLDDPRMITVGEAPQTGFLVQLVAALCGEGEMCVDLRAAPAKFAGEDTLHPLGEVARDDSDPTSVIAAMIQAVKLGDQEAWQGLFSGWRLVSGKIDTAFAPTPEALSEAWETSRRLITGPVYDARVEGVDPVRTVLRGDAKAGVPQVEEATVWIDLYGLFDGEYRSYVDVRVIREWTLQRVSGGPWRIVSLQQL